MGARETRTRRLVQSYGTPKNTAAAAYPILLASPPAATACASLARIMTPLLCRSPRVLIAPIAVLETNNTHCADSPSEQQESAHANDAMLQWGTAPPAQSSRVAPCAEAATPPRHRSSVSCLQ